MMHTFTKFLESKLLVEIGPPAPGGVAPGGIAAPGSLPGGTGLPPAMPGGMGAAPGMGMPGGMGGMPGGMPGAGGGGTAPQKLKAYNVWDVLERVLGQHQHHQHHQQLAPNQNFPQV